MNSSAPASHDSGHLVPRQTGFRFTCQFSRWRRRLRQRVARRFAPAQHQNRHGIYVRSLGRDSLRDLPYRNRTGISRSTRILTSVIASRFELRAEVVNIVNHLNFSSPLLPNFIADAAQNGFTQSGPREVSQGNYAVIATAMSASAIPSWEAAPRRIQLAAKFSF